MVNQQNFPAVSFNGDETDRHIIIRSNLASLGGKLYHSQLYAVSAISIL